MNNNETKTTYELRITADEIKATDPTFTMKNLRLGDNYQPKRCLLSYGRRQK